MKEISGEQLLAFTEANYWEGIGEGPTFKVKVKCVDGTKVTTNRLLHWAWGYLSFNRHYNVPVHMSQIPEPALVPKASVHLKYLNNSMGVVYTYFGGKEAFTEIAHHWVEAANISANATITKLERYGLSIDAEDFVEFMNTKVIKDLKDNVRCYCNDTSLTPERRANLIGEANIDLLHYVRTEGLNDFPKNGLAQHIHGDISKTEQFTQGVLSVGYVAEIDSMLHTTPVAESFADGMLYNYTYGTNMSVYKKALMYNKDPLEDTETLHRLSQMVTSAIRFVHVGDCGSTSTFPIHVKREWANRLVGSFHLSSKGIQEIGVEDLDSIVGTTIHLRNPCGCNVTQDGGICLVCCGSAAESLVPHFNVGHGYGTRFYGGTSQLVLKVKHVEVLTVGVAPQITKALLDYTYLSPDNRELLYGGISTKVSISFSAQEHKVSKTPNATLLHTLKRSDNIADIPTSNFSSIRTITLDPGDPSIGCILEDVEILRENKLSLAHGVLQYIKDNPSKLTMYLAKGGRYRYNLNLDELPHGTGLFVCPFKVFDMLAQYEVVNTFVASVGTGVHGKALTDYNTFGEAAEHLLDITYEKLGINLALLMIAILPYTVRDLQNRDYRMAKGTNRVSFIPQRTVFRERSLSIKLPAERQTESISKLRLVTNTKVEAHIYDASYL